MEKVRRELEARALANARELTQLLVDYGFLVLAEKRDVKDIYAKVSTKTGDPSTNSNQHPTEDSEGSDSKRRRSLSKAQIEAEAAVNISEASESSSSDVAPPLVDSSDEDE
jgi:hypothetical protein